MYKLIQRTVVQKVNLRPYMELYKPRIYECWNCCGYKGAVSTVDLKNIGTQVQLSNTYHLHVRTGDEE